ncbi:MAG: hypothetical protein HFH50_00035 [Lachnospiraceae bacterium]|jgi:hypothetical protein|nr:hypothetical protein [Lachnospiraceae bacterium]
MKKRLFSVMIIVCMAAILAGCAKGGEAAKSPEDLYRDAVRDAAFADDDEILPLVSLVESDPMTTWQNGKALLLTWHNYPESYPEGETVTIQWGPVWVFTDKEIASHAEELQKADDAEARLKQIISFAPDSEHSTVTGLWVDPKNVKRPAYQSDPTIEDMSNSFDENVDEDFKSWFDDNTLWSYFYGEYPWTRLGYTYDWADNDTEYGMTEFIVEDGAQVTVEFTETTEEFLNRITNDKEE